MIQLKVFFHAAFTACISSIVQIIKRCWKADHPSRVFFCEVFHFIFRKFHIFSISMFLSIHIRSCQAECKYSISNIHVQIGWIKFLCDGNTSSSRCMRVGCNCCIRIITVSIIRNFVSDLLIACHNTFFYFFPCILDLISILAFWKDFGFCFPSIFGI